MSHFSRNEKQNIDINAENTQYISSTLNISSSDFLSGLCKPPPQKKPHLDIVSHHHKKSKSMTCKFTKKVVRYQTLFFKKIALFIIFRDIIETKEGIEERT